MHLSYYGDGEELVGKWFKRTGKRDQIFLATKFGYVKGSGAREINSTYEYCKQACAESLRLLGTDYIDLCTLCTPNAFASRADMSWQTTCTMRT